MLEREKERERERESEGEGDEQSGGERGGKTSHLRSFFSRSHLSLFSSASYSRYAFRHTFRVATILLPSFVSSFPFLRFSSRSRLRFVIFVTVPCVSERKTASNVGRYFSSPWTYRSERERETRGDAMRSLTKERKRQSQRLPFFPSSFLVYLFISYIIRVPISIRLYLFRSKYSARKVVVT